jgi:hypothetical protein
MILSPISTKTRSAYGGPIFKEPEALKAQTSVHRHETLDQHLS